MSIEDASKRAALSTVNLSFVVPVFNEAETLVELAARLAAVVEQSQLGPYEIIFVDDGSDDGSWELIRKMHAAAPDTIVGIKLRRNFGKADALAAGFSRALGDIVITLDGDLQDDPIEVPNFIKKLNEGYDLVSGWKKERKDPLEKRIPSKIFNLVTSFASGIKLHDFNCGFKAYKRKVLPHLRLYGELHRFIPAIAHASGFHVAEIPVLHHPREHGCSKFGCGRYLKCCLDLLTVITTTRFLKRPLHLFGSSGILIGLFSFLILAYLSLGKLFWDIPIHGRPLFFLGILGILFAGQLLSVGVLAELLVRVSNHSQSNAQIEELLQLRKR